MLGSVLVMFVACFVLFVFFFKQKTAYEMRISDWSSDVCSSDLAERGAVRGAAAPHAFCRAAAGANRAPAMTRGAAARAPRPAPQADLFGTASLPGLAYSDDFVTPAEETEHNARIAAANLAPFPFQQWEGNRRTRTSSAQHKSELQL